MKNYFNQAFHTSICPPSLSVYQARWYYYLLLGLVDVEANYLVVKAYQYTSITSIMLLDCWSIPSVILLTWLFLKTKYRYKKIAGVAICIDGLVLVIFSDVHADDRSREYTVGQGHGAKNTLETAVSCTSMEKAQQVKVGTLSLMRKLIRLSREHYFNTEEFIDTVADELKARLVGKSSL